MDWLGIVDLNEFNGLDPLDSAEWASSATLEGESRSLPLDNHSLHSRSVANSHGPLSRPPSKIGTRFSKEAVGIMRAWFASHEQNPYPTEQERMNLELQTGLNSTQVSNWLANARRRRPRGFIHEPAPSSRQQSPAPITIPERPGTPMIPMQRWMDSPPEDEPAEVAFIVRAMEHNSCRLNNNDSPIRGWGEGSSRCSSASSVESSHSRSSSLRSGVSWISSNSRRWSRRHPSRRKLARNLDTTSKKPLVTPARPFQCTFCTDTFGNKHEWQRHENSLHLPVGRWKCCPDQPRAVTGADNQVCCVFCGELDPSSAHIDNHNPKSCQEREFARKDHLKQHLRLVHGATLLDIFQSYWKADAPDITSRCGFCGMALDTWQCRVDHLADHFKAGQNMADWEGDWGFENFILDKVENAIPPYLIATERDTPLPFAASSPAVAAPRCAYERMKLDLLWFIQTYQDKYGHTPDDEMVQLEACRIVFSLDSVTPEEALERDAASSWLRDLITSHPDITLKAQLGPLRYENESAFSAQAFRPRAMSIFEGCPLEYELRRHVCQKWESGQAELDDAELQDAACKAVFQIDKKFTMPLNKFMAEWLVRVITSSTVWLQKFKERMQAMKLRVHGAKEGSSAVPRVENDLMLVEWDSPRLGTAKVVEAAGTSVSNRWQDEGFGIWDVGIDSKGPLDPKSSAEPADPQILTRPPTKPPLEMIELPSRASTDQFFPIDAPSGFRTNPNRFGLVDQQPPWITTNFYTLNDAKYHKWLSRELKRWVMATISSNNPTMHIPSDEELRHQARCFMYDEYVNEPQSQSSFGNIDFSSDDTWNRTPADNPEWLRRFREEAGIGQQSEDQEKITA